MTDHEQLQQDPDDLATAERRAKRLGRDAENLVETLVRDRSLLQDELGAIQFRLDTAEVAHERYACDEAQATRCRENLAQQIADARAKLQAARIDDQAPARA